MRMAAAVLLATLAASASAWAQQPPAGDPARGQALYRASGCWQCHGTVGHGGAWQGPKLAPDPMPFDAFLAQLRRPIRSMPPYRAAVLSDAEAADIHAYLRSVPKGPAADQIGRLGPGPTNSRGHDR